MVELSEVRRPEERRWGGICGVQCGPPVEVQRCDLEAPGIELLIQRVVSGRRDTDGVGQSIAEVLIILLEHLLPRDDGQGLRNLSERRFGAGRYQTFRRRGDQDLLGSNVVLGRLCLRGFRWWPHPPGRGRRRRANRLRGQNLNGLRIEDLESELGAPEEVAKCGRDRIFAVEAGRPQAVRNTREKHDLYAALPGQLLQSAAQGLWGNLQSHLRRIPVPGDCAALNRQRQGYGEGTAYEFGAPGAHTRFTCWDKAHVSAARSGGQPRSVCRITADYTSADGFAYSPDE